MDIWLHSQSTAKLGVYAITETGPQYLYIQFAFACLTAAKTVQEDVHVLHSTTD